MPGLMGPDRLRAVSEAALEAPGPDGVEVLTVHEWGGLTRFARSAIHQNTWREDTGLKVRVVSQDRVAVASTNDLSEDGARRAVAEALEAAEVSAPDPLFPGLAPKAPVEAFDAYDEATASTAPAEQAERVASLLEPLEGDLEGSGAYETQCAEVALANTEGQWCYFPATQAEVSVLVSGGGGAGYGEAFARTAAGVAVEDVGKRAARKARDSRDPVDVEVGRYDVVLEPLAVSTLVAFLSWLGFGGRAILEGRSCFSGRIGEKVAADSITIYDDALSPDTLGLPFDFEGTPKRRVDLIEKGVILGGVHDRRSAKMAGTNSTGHALPPPNTQGAFPLNLFLATGDASLEDMIRSTERGLLVTRFHYSNVVHPREAVITGMTRDGTWLIEDGKVSRPVKNLRFTQSILEALTNTEAVGSESVLASEFFFAASRVPALKVRDFNFTGKSDH